MSAGGPQSRQGTEDENNNTCPCRESKPGFEPVRNCFTKSTIPTSCTTILTNPVEHYFVYGLFSDAAVSSCHAVSHDTMLVNKELERMRNEEVVA